MSATRIILTPAQHSALAATPLPFNIIWSEDNFDAIIKAAERGATMTYLGYLLEYKRTLLESNPIYNDDGKSEKQLELLQAIPRYAATIPDEEFELRAATLNLYGLLLKDTKDFAAARATLESALEINNLSLLSKASLLHTLASIYAAEKNSDASFEKLFASANCLEGMEFIYSLDKHIAATIYSSLADIYVEKEKDVMASCLHEDAIELWPENNVIANHFAIFHSKRDVLTSLTKAETVLAKHYDKAVAENRFVTPFYRADVNIKLAGQAIKSGDAQLVSDYLKRARDYWGKAHTAIISANYKGSYQNKGLARLEYLATNIAYVEQDYSKMELHAAGARNYRTQVDEPQAKQQKFFAKFPTQTLFNTAELFRRKTVAVPAAEPVQTERKLNL